MCERSPRLHNQLSALVTSGSKTSRASQIDVAGTPPELLKMNIGGAKERGNGQQSHSLQPFHLTFLASLGNVICNLPYISFVPVLFLVP